MKAPADLLLLPQWVVPVESEGPLAGHAVVVEDGRILDVLPADAAQARYDAVQTLPLPGRALIPGLVNLHGHAAMSLFRGYADDLPLMAWLNDRIWPAEKKHVSEAFVRDGTLLAAAEMLAGGITTCNDMYFFPKAAGEAFLQAGMRATLGMIVLEFPSAYASDADDYLAKGLALRDELKDESLLGFAFAPHAPYTVSDTTFGRINTLAEQLGLPIHTHIHETADEIRDSLKQYGVRPLERLARLGLLGPNFIGVHAVHVNEAEIGLLAQHGCHLAHCPTSNLKLASGIAPVADLLRAGVNVGLGTDGAASNNRLDLFGEMRLAALLAKGASGDPAILSAAATLRAATLDAARALNLDSQIGSIVPGKRADLVAVDLHALSGQPVFDPVSHLVYVAGREHVTHVWVDGKLKLNDRRLVNLDIDDLTARAAYWRTKLAPQG
ncbi:MAG: TRZ/ATZ family hydrolase [Thiobacillus sp.]|uniref:TRZ/ATZ family hydrolase n=1 Tax=unclassified Thiobacillus TaxID=2646513 RepID=UPI00086D3C8C|nr:MULTISPECIES: TRZ/ATZ family hydrolase [unclassified Thiobacillus]MBN8770816.1 TRZ/ATZ family hydrolase [Thiobacillus sp.]MBN8780514.1 TRZ/ATZ family hydrolase [Thiobacillus sp.]ODU99544.1 MAG: N-ethylammeline chlorohydrolase [Thiobacillus sp. SCN 63-57]OJY55821.1 MAG: N-ethylammeline chlorohydrolase [Thiobacillus sp. 0-1251]